MNQIIELVVQLVLIVVSALMTAYVIPWLKTNRNKKEVEVMINIIGQVVRFVEQNKDWSKVTDKSVFKKEQALYIANKILSELGIRTNDELVGNMIEAEVYKMNSTKSH